MKNKTIIILVTILSVSMVLFFLIKNTFYYQSTTCQLETIEIQKVYSGIASYYEITAYCLNQNPMASGKKVYNGAVANNQYPLGTKVRISGKIYILEDRMNRRFPERWDIWFFSCDDAINWGIKKLPVDILDN